MHNLLRNNCTICLETIVSEEQAPCEGEKPKTLDCSHIFHRECIGSWLEKKPNCPICRRIIVVATPEARLPEMTLQEILTVPHNLHPITIEQEDLRGILFLIRENILETRRVRQLHLNQYTPQTFIIKKVNYLALNFFSSIR